MGAAESCVEWLSVEELQKINNNLVKVTRTREEDTGHFAEWTVAGPEPGKRVRLKYYYTPFSEREGGRDGLRAVLAGETRLHNGLLKHIASYMSHPHMLARKTAERKYAEMYRRLDPEDPARASLVPPDEPLRVPSKHGMNSDLQAVAVICGKAFGEAFYRDWLWAKFDEYPGRAKGKLVTQFGRDEAMRRMVASGHIKPARCANLSYIHRPNAGGINSLWKNAYPVELVPWPRSVLQDFSGRLLIQPVDRRVVFKGPKMSTPSSRRCPGKWDGVEVVSPESLVEVHAGRSVCVAVRLRAHAGVAAAQIR